MRMKRAMNSAARRHRPLTSAAMAGESRLRAQDDEDDVEQRKAAAAHRRTGSTGAMQLMKDVWDVSVLLGHLLLTNKAATTLSPPTATACRQCCWRSWSAIGPDPALTAQGI